MTKLSPAAQAVKDAAQSAYCWICNADEFFAIAAELEDHQ